MNTRRRAPSASGPGSPAALTLITGSEGFLVSRAVADVLTAARTVDPAVERRDVDVEDPDAIGNLQTSVSPSLFGESAVVVVAPLADAGDPLVDALVAALADLPDEIWVVVLHAGAKGKRHLDRLRRLQPARGLDEVACTPPKRGPETRDLLLQEARRAGRRLSTDGAEALVLALGSDLSVLVGGLRQVMADRPEDPIDSAAVAGSFAGVAEVSGFQVADALWAGDARQALRHLRLGLAGQTVNGVGVVASMAAALRTVVAVGSAPRGMPDRDLARSLGLFESKVKRLREWSRGWESWQLAEAVIALAEADARVKGGLRPGESLDPVQKMLVLESFLVSTAGLGGSPQGRTSDVLPGVEGRHA